MDWQLLQVYENDPRPIISPQMVDLVVSIKMKLEGFVDVSSFIVFF
jgi:hypothetical protein